MLDADDKESKVPQTEKLHAFMGLFKDFLEFGGETVKSLIASPLTGYIVAWLFIDFLEKRSYRDWYGAYKTYNAPYTQEEITAAEMKANALANAQKDSGVTPTQQIGNVWSFNFSIAPNNIPQLTAPLLSSPLVIVRAPPIPDQYPFVDMVTAANLKTAITAFFAASAATGLLNTSAIGSIIAALPKALG